MVLFVGHVECNHLNIKNQEMTDVASVLMAMFDLKVRMGEGNV